EMTYDQESGITNSIQKGLEFYWSMSMPDNGGSGYQTVTIEPQIITPVAGAGAVPWAPGTYAPYQPWLITYNLLSADMTSGTPPSVRTQRLATEVDPRLSGTITMTPASPKKGEMVEFKADPAPGYVFSHWKAWGIELDDFSSSTANGRVKDDISTIRAYFEQSGSGLIDAADFRIPPGPAEGSVGIRGKIPDELTWAVAMGVKYPLDVTVGSTDFLFGPTVGERTVLSPQEILFTTKNKKNETSQLKLNFNTKTWRFSSPQTQNLGGSVLGTHTVRLGLSGRDFTGVEDLPLAGTEVFSWTGGDPAIINDVFSFDKNTVISGNLTFQGVGKGMSTFRIRGAGLTNGTIDPTLPVILTANQVKVQFDNATKSDNSVYTYTKSEGDLFSSLVLDTRSKTWQVDMSGKRLTHTTWPEDVPIGLQIGTKAARVTVNLGITVNLYLPGKEPVQADFTAVPQTGTPPLVVQFSDLSGGHPTSWDWTFGDGSSSEKQDPGHTYTSEGSYTVILTVRNGEGSSTIKKSNFIIVNQPPEPILANFTVSPTNGMAPLTVKCTDKSTGKPSMLIYNFGDGSNVTGPNPVHTYKFPGNYTISLTITKYNPATGSVESSVATKTNVITVSKVPFVMPVAKFMASPTSGTVPLAVTFTDQSTGDPTRYYYNFGDGVNLTGPNQVHTYRLPGVYNVTLTVLKNDPSNGSVVSNVSVQKNCIIVR
ncbi:MAG: PKD domain-containing protein, partial [Methanomicrobiales archaeon]